MRQLKTADAKYRRWILSEQQPRVDVATVQPWAAEIEQEHGSIREAAEYAGVDVETLRRVLKGKHKRVYLTVAERVAEAAGRTSELFASLPEVGEAGWSKVGRWCGDGAIGFDGCGTWFHPCHVGGLCEDCYAREALGWPIQPRDERVTQKWGAAQ